MHSLMSSLGPELRAYGSEILAELRRIRPSSVSACFNFLRSKAPILCVAFVLFILFHQVYFWTGRHFMFSGALYLDNGLYGWDIPRSVDDMLVPGHNARSNVHPFYVLYAKPLAAFYHQVLGLTKHTSAIAVSAMMGGLSVVGAMVYLLAWGAALPESALFACIFGAGTTAYLCGAAPESRAFSNFTIIVLELLACLSLRRGIRSHLLWILSGIFSYGTTIFTVLKNIVAFTLSARALGLARRVVTRSLSYSIIVIAVSVLLTIAAGSSFNLLGETQFTDPEKRGGNLDGILSHLVRNFLIYDFVAPSPTLENVTFGEMNNKIVTFKESQLVGFQTILALFWGGMLVASIALALLRRQRSEIKMAAILAFCLAMDFALFSQYYVNFEGIFVWTPYVAFSVFAFTAFLAEWISKLPAPARIASLAVLAAFFIGQFVNNFLVLMESARLLS
ncbi:hypothetical protein IIC65_01015 [Candidatus Sumerlaeota bacterium]|nr:hypothetical protein [Candidatus Sumerlaeota bacterium]